MRLKDYPRSSVTLFAGLVLAAGALVLFSWLAEEVFEGDARHFDEQVRAVVIPRAAWRLRCGSSRWLSETVYRDATNSPRNTEVA